MRLLIATQKVDRNDPILGFFHQWIVEFAKNFENVSVVCLEKGDYDLPENVQVFSLGKENINSNKFRLLSRIRYIFNFYKYLWRLKGGYNAVFVHMNQEYVLLGGLFWKLTSKKIFLWRNHPKGSFLTRIAVWFSEKVFCTSSQSFTARFKKGVLMPVGIDTDIFQIPNTKLQIPNSILSLGRISPIKNIDKMLEALNILDNKDKDFIFDIVGGPVNEEDFGYLESLKNKYKNIIEKKKVNFLGSIKNSEAPDVYKSHKIFINLTPSGSMDKTILEAAACGCVPVVANKFFEQIFDPNMIVADSLDGVADKIEFWLLAEDGYINVAVQKLQNYVLENHSLNALVSELTSQIK